jgi:hypothetical protein
VGGIVGKLVSNPGPESVGLVVWRTLFKHGPGRISVAVERERSCHVGQEERC